MNLMSWIRLALGKTRQPIRRPAVLPPARKPAKHPGVRLETLEDRCTPSTFRTIDGTGNNLAHPTWGSAGTDFLRIAPAEYSDGASTPSGADRPNARTISNALMDHPEGDLKNDRSMSAFVYAWGQFLDHDLDLTNSASPAQAFNIQVPTGDPEFDPAGTGTQVIPLNRSNFDALTGTSSANPRQQVNSITAFVDGSMVYGSDAATAASLRTFSGGHLKTSANNLLPIGSDGFFQAGDVRANENPELQSLQTLFVREHNRQADRLAAANPTLSDEQLYQQARRTVIGEIQAITYNEFLPALLGQPLKPYAGYNPNVNPGIANEFATAAYRLGHSMVGNDIEFLDNNGNEIHEAVDLKDAFFNVDLVKETNIDPILKYLASDKSEEIDLKVVDSLRNFLFGPPGAGGLDLASLNIQRGRDHGLADYNDARAAYGLPKVRSFADITSNKAVQMQLQQVYGSVDKIDLWVGGLAEDHVPGGSVGPTFARIIANQFERLRDGDRFWYQREFTGMELGDIANTTLASVIRRNSNLTNLQDNVFFFKTAITGTVFGDMNRDGQRNGPEMGLGGRKVELLDASGAVIATAITRSDGSYCFNDVGLGTFQVREVLPPGTVATTQPRTVQITRGGTIDKVDLGEAPTTTPLIDGNLMNKTCP